MNPKLNTDQRITAIKRVIEHKDSINSVCKELGISRTIFYTWLSRYKKYGEEGIVVGKRIKVIKQPSEIEYRVLDIVKRYPLYSSKKISIELGLNNLGKPILGNHGVQNILERNNLSKEIERIKYAENKSEILKIEGKKILNAEEKLNLIERNIIGKEEVSDLCKEYGISRTLFYKFKRKRRIIKTKTTSS